MRNMMFVAVLVMGIFLSSSAFAREDFIQVKGSDTMVNLGQAWAEKFMELHPEAFIAVTGGGSGTGIASMISGTCDVAMCSRTIKDKEVAMAGQKDIFFQELIVAKDGLAVVVHPDNPVDKVTLKQLADIFTGTIVNWKELGGQDARIVLLSREVNSGTHVYFKEHVLRNNDPQGTAEFAPGALLLSSSQAIADEVGQNPAAIGYYGMGYISAGQKAVAVAVDAESEYVTPTIDNVISGAYPISRPLFLYTNGQPQGQLKEFLEFVLSPEGQRVVVETDFVPVREID